MSSENLDTPEMNGHPESLSDMNGHPDTFAATPETKGPSGEAASPAIQIDIPLSDPSGDTESPTSHGQPDYIVGYGRPPEASRFKKGQSGNPLGRPKARRNVRSEIEDALTESVPVNPSRHTTMRARHRHFSQTVQKALNGDHRSAEAVLKRAKEFGVLQKGPSYEELLATILHPDDDD